jgi:hypothetical protein
MIFFCGFLTLVSSNLLKFSENLKGPGYWVLHKYSMYSNSDIYGPQSPYLNITCKNYLGVPVKSLGHITILQPSLYKDINISTICTNSSTNYTAQAELSANSLYIPIKVSGVYSIIISLCEEVSVNIEVYIQSMNPYGEVNGDYVYLIPV